MKMTKGVEWAAHTCALLALLPNGAALPGDALAEFLGVPTPYLAKQLQALSRAGIVQAKRGVAGGYRLAQQPDALSLWDVMAAIDGADPAFRCTEVRRSGPCGAAAADCKKPCPIAAAFHRAEAGYRQALRAVRLTDVVAGVAEEAAPARKRQIVEWLEQHAAVPA
ncbi:MAG: Rrf2 family transcriptional regulator [Pseudomonadota bacterium]